MMESELICQICSMLYRTPVILPCSDSLCFQCAEQCFELGEKQGNPSWVNWLDTASIKEAERKREVKCPICKEKIILPSRGVHGLSRNKVLERIVNKHLEEKEQKVNQSKHLAFPCLFFCLLCI